MSHFIATEQEQDNCVALDWTNIQAANVSRDGNIVARESPN